jgi:uncharacterized protein (TIGR03067 family)
MVPWEANKEFAMKPHATVFRTMGIVVVLAGVGSPVGSRPLADAQAPITPGTPQDAKEAAIKKEKEKLIGVWKLVSCGAQGERVPEKILKGEVVRWAITEKTITSTVGGQGKGEDKYTLDPTAHPKAIDLTDREGRRTPGIYSLDDDTLKVCLNEGGEERPKVFASKPDTHLSVWVFRREKR